MNFPRTRKTHVAMAIGVAATSVLVVVGPGSATATAGRLLGSAGIKNNSIRSIDIHDGTIRGKDVKDGSLTAKDFSGTLRGAAGPRGPAGPAGGSGTTTSTWTVHGAAGSNFVALTSADNIPVGTQVSATKLSITGAFQGCTYGTATLEVNPDEVLGTSRWTASSGAWTPATLAGGGYTMSAASPLKFIVSCTDLMNPQPVPAFDATVVLSQTKRDTAGGSAFN